MPKVAFDSDATSKTYYTYIPDYWIEEGLKDGIIIQEGDAFWTEDRVYGRVRVLKYERFPYSQYDRN